MVVPAYNEERLIKKTLQGLPDFVDRIYVVDDGSKDATPQILETLTSPRLSLVRHQRNRGVGAAIVTGYKKALAEDVDIAVVMAGDNQMDPAYLPALLTPLIEGGADYAKGNRMSGKEYLRGMSHWRRFGNWLLRWLTRIAAGNYRITDPQNGYTAITREGLERLSLDSIYPWYGYCNDMLVKLSVVGARICEVPIPARYQGEKSKIRYWKYIPEVSMLLVKDLLWRLRRTYLERTPAIR